MKLLSKTSDPPSFRGEFLGLIGLFDVAYGLHYITADRNSVIHIFGNGAWGYIFILVGLILFAGSFCKNERWFFALAVFMQVLWATEFTWLSFTVPFSWIQGIIWYLLALITIRVAALSDPARIKITVPENPDVSND